MARAVARWEHDDPQPDVQPMVYIVAEAVDGTIWTGPFIEQVTLSAFHRCTGLGATNAQTVGFRKVDTKAHDHFRLVK